MDVKQKIKQHIAALTEVKRDEVQTLHSRILQIFPDCKLWFDDGKNADGKTITNPTIGYGQQILKYANGTTKDYFKIGVSANQSGISVYILGIKDKNFLSQAYGEDIGKAKITGYCIKFNKLADVNMDTLEAALRYGFAHSPENETADSL